MSRKVRQKNSEHYEKQVGGALNCNDSELCTFLLALAEGYLPTFYSDTSPSVQLSGMDIASKSYQHGKKTVTFHGFQSLEMFKPLTDDLGEELLTLYRAGFPVKTYPSQEKAQGLTESDQGCGHTWQGSFVKYDPVLSLWKTHQCSFLEDSGESLATWPKWGLMQGGACWEVVTLDSTPNAIEYGFWPTPAKSDGTQHGKEKWIKNSRSKRISLGKAAPTEKITYVYFESNIPMKYWPELSEELMTWPRGWTRLEPLETDKFQQWQQQLGKS